MEIPYDIPNDVQIEFINSMVMERLAFREKLMRKAKTYATSYIVPFLRSNNYSIIVVDDGKKWRLVDSNYLLLAESGENAKRNDCVPQSIVDFLNIVIFPPAGVLGCVICFASLLDSSKSLKYPRISAGDVVCSETAGGRGC